MKWWPETCRPGDMVRVGIGSIWHYGIFISESEIIQFGPPPVSLTAIDESQICVCTATAEEFSCGNIIERAILDKNEKRRRLPPQKTIETARARLGETGYSLLHNNCEHFAYECVFGVKRSTQEEEARERWNKRPVMDVYIAFRRSLTGKWNCDRFCFSLSHTEGAVIVGISNRKIGVDIENIAAVQQNPVSSFAEKIRKDKKTPKTGKRPQYGQYLQINSKQDLPPQYRPMSPWAYFGLFLLYSIPVVGFVFMIVFSFSKGNINRRNFTISFWVMLLFVVTVVIIAAVVLAPALRELVESLMSY